MKRTLIHPHKVVWAMRDFINDISDLVDPNTYYDIPSGADIFDIDFDWESYIIPSPKRECKMFKSDGFKTVFDEDTHFIKIGYNLDQNTTRFRNNFVKRCPMARGFSSVTLALLHELGHQYVEDDVSKVCPEYNRKAALDMGRILCHTQDDWDDWYMNIMVDETMATDWAIDWLNDPEHRKIAKVFEKKFFACFK